MHNFTIIAQSQAAAVFVVRTQCDKHHSIGTQHIYVCCVSIKSSLRPVEWLPFGEKYLVFNETCTKLMCCYICSAMNTQHCINRRPTSTACYLNRTHGTFLPYIILIIIMHLCAGFTYSCTTQQTLGVLHTHTFTIAFILGFRFGKHPCIVCKSDRERGRHVNVALIALRSNTHEERIKLEYVFLCARVVFAVWLDDFKHDVRYLFGGLICSMPMMRWCSNHACTEANTCLYVNCILSDPI